MISVTLQDGRKALLNLAEIAAVVGPSQHTAATVHAIVMLRHGDELELRDDVHALQARIAEYRDQVRAACQGCTCQPRAQA